MTASLAEGIKIVFLLPRKDINFVVCRWLVKCYNYGQLHMSPGYYKMKRDKMKNRWLDAPTEEGFWWKRISRGLIVADTITFIEIRDKNPTFPIMVQDMDGKKNVFIELPHITYQKVKDYD